MNHGVPKQSYKKKNAIGHILHFSRSPGRNFFRSSMMMRKSTVAVLSILAAVAIAHPYAEWNHARYRWNELFAARDEEVGARIRSQTTVEPSSCTTVTYKNEKSHRVRICSADPEGTSLHVASLQLVLSAEGGVCSPLKSYPPRRTPSKSGSG